MVADQDIIGQAYEIVREATARGALERAWPDRNLPNDYRASPNTAWNGRGTDTDYAALEMSYGWIVDAFRNAIPPDPSAFTGIAAEMNAAATALRGGTQLLISKVTTGPDGKPRLVPDERSTDDAINKVAGDTDKALTTWNGPAALAFRSNFVGAVPNVVENQTAVILSLQSAAEGCQKVYEAAREKLLITATTTLNVLRHKDDLAAPDLSIPLSVASGGFAVAAAVPGIGTAGVLVLTTVGAAVSVGKDIYGEARNESEKQRKERDSKRSPAERAVDGFHIGGATVEAVLSRTHEAINAISRQVAEAEDTIIRMLETNINAMRHSPRDFVSPRPYFVDYTTNTRDLRTLTEGGGFVSIADTGHGIR